MPTVRIERIASRQWGVVARRQVLDCELSNAGISRLMRAGWLHRIHPRVYAVGHRALSIEARLAAALLYAGPEAGLSHHTAAWWWGLLGGEIERIHVSTRRHCRSRRDLVVHHPRNLRLVSHRELSVTDVARTLLDLAAVAPFRIVRRSLAEADYRRLLTPADLEATVDRGHPGASTLRRALARHQPRLARTLSMLEERFVALCEEHGIPAPQVNARVAGLMVDALWAQQRVIVELDGHAAHATPAAIERDPHRDLALRAAGYRVHRYTWQQITERPDQVVTDLRAALDGGSIPLPHRR